MLYSPAKSLDLTLRFWRLLEKEARRNDITESIEPIDGCLDGLHPTHGRRMMTRLPVKCQVFDEPLIPAR